MQNAKSLLPILAILLCVSLSCTFLKDRFSGGEQPARTFAQVAKLPPNDPKKPLVSPGAVAVRRLAETDPSATVFADAIEASELGAMKQTIAAISGENVPDQKKQTSSISPEREIITTPLSSPKIPSPHSPATMMMWQAGEVPLPGLMDGALVGMLTGNFKGLLVDVEGGNFTQKFSKTETDAGTTSIMDLELGGHDDGSTSLEFGIRSESTKNGVKVNTELQGRIDGQDCPNAEGQIPITVKVRLSARSGSGGYTQDLTVFIRLIVDDNADIASTTIDITQGTSRGRNGQEVYVETGQTIKLNGYDWNGATQSNQHLVQNTDNASADDVYKASESGYAAAYGAAIGAIHTAEKVWKGGGCIRIEAKSPGLVSLNSRTEIPVKVFHKKDKSEISAKVDAALTGGASVEPTIIPKTPGTLAYTAPGETGKSATIKLTASSRRGRATLDLAASTGQKSYHAEGSSQGAFFKGDICALDKHFTINVDSKTGKWPMEFTPESESAGQMEGTFSGSGCTLTGGGPYTVSIGPNGSGTITFTYNSTATCPGLAPAQTSRTSTIALTPAPDLKCP